MSSRYFPIKTETACALKWNWSTVVLHTGTTSSCHRVNTTTLTEETFDQFHNTDKKIADRQLMLDGKWPTGGCEFCKNIEDAGGSSDRMLHLKIPDMHPVELDADLTATQVTPTILEVYFDNTCNMSCVYCNENLSSKIQQENAKFGPFEKGGIVLDNRTNTKIDISKQLTEKLWQWMANNGHKLKRFHVLGGEPFYQSEFDHCLEFFDQHPHPELEFNVISNLMISPERFSHKIDLIKNLVARRRLKRFDLTASIDCWGAEQEYVRQGLDLETWQKNFEYLVKQKWITLNINQTLSALTIKTVPALLQYINRFRTDRKIGQYFSTTVQTHKCLHPEIFGSGFFDQDFEHILAHMPDQTAQQIEARQYMKGIQSQLNSTARNQQQVDQLGVLLDELDRRRRTDWRTTFPWLTKELTHVV
jgi:organic radical activating enzyme